MLASGAESQDRRRLETTVNWTALGNTDEQSQHRFVLQCLAPFSALLATPGIGVQGGKLLEGRGMPAIFIIALPPPNTIGGPALIISLQVYPAAPERQRPARRGHDDGGGFVKTKMGICREKKERSDCYCVYIEREDIRDSILKKTCTLNNCFAEMLLICSFAPATLPQPL
eukprot:XP_024308443.1 uncharacterized protein LOC112268398 [Homo sapiens]